MKREPEIPNPGSEAAVLAGCTCAVLDNNHGRRPPYRGGWWVTMSCPLHAMGAPTEPEESA